LRAPLQPRQQIELVNVYTTVDPKVDPTGELPNVYVVSVLKCQCCDEMFELERVDVRFVLSTPSTTPQINEISLASSLSTLRKNPRKQYLWLNVGTTSISMGN